jgi:hypothetical protein
MHQIEWTPMTSINYRVFQTGNHIKEFQLCGDGSGLNLVNDNEVEFMFHWDSQNHCDLVDDVILHSSKVVGWTGQ